MEAPREGGSADHDGGDRSDGRGTASSSSNTFERASLHTRVFLCLGRCLETKKTCLLILVVGLILLVEFTKLFVPPGSLGGLQDGAERVIQLATRVLENGAAAAAAGVHAHPLRDAAANDTAAAARGD